MNNPLKYVDPSGHDPLSAQWRKEFRERHGRDPDWRDESIRLFSIAFPDEWDYGAFYDENGDVRQQSMADIYSKPPKSRSWSAMPGALDNLARWYTPEQEAMFVHDVASLFAGLKSRNEPSDYGTFGALLEGGRHPAVYLDPGGLAPEWHDNNRDGNANVHHWAGFFATGYFLGGMSAESYNESRELNQAGGNALAVDRSDLMMGKAAAWMGGALSPRGVTPASIGALLLRYLPIQYSGGW